MSSSDQTSAATNGASTNGATTNGAATNGISTNGTPTNSSTTNGTTTNGASNGPPSVSSLPPEALDLASKLFTLAREGSTPTLSAYLTAGIPPNLTNGSGDTLLMLASYHGHHATALMLLDAGADPNVLNARAQSPIAGAVFKGYGDVVKVLLERGADIELGHPTAVDCARMFQRREMCDLFGVEMGDGRGFMNGVS